MKKFILSLLFCSSLLGQRFSAIGDYGDNNSNELAVSNLVKSWNPDFIITLGDNNYDHGLWETIDENIGQYYHEFIYPYIGGYGQGSDINRFFPSPGNHDHNNPNLLQYYLEYFDLLPYSGSSGNERYYDFVWGNIHFFSVNSCTMEPDGYIHPSVQSAWLEAQLANCDSNHSHWRIVFFHHAAYSSGQHGSETRMQWPFKEWSADVVMAGHDHTYERIIIEDLPYFVNGLGGKTRYNFDPPIPGSEVRYNEKYGAMLVEADQFMIAFSFYSVDDELIDYYEIIRPYPSTPTNLTAQVNYSPLSVELNWNDNSGNEDGFIIEREIINSDIFETIDTVTANEISYLDTNVSYSTYNYRIKAFNEFGESPYSDTVEVQITDPLPLPPGELIAQVSYDPLVVELLWTDNSNNENGFIIERDIINSDDFEIIDTVGADVTVYVDTSITYLTYIYRIKAFNEYGNSPYSDTAQVIVPVELISFTAGLIENTVLLEWITATELNNLGFEVQKEVEDSWTTIGFVTGYGNSVNYHEYEFSDIEMLSGKLNRYRLKQIDYKGTYSYSYSVELFVPVRNYKLEQNFPNPFNPVTTIKVEIAEDDIVSLKLFDIFGQDVKTILDEFMKADIYEIQLDASNLASGVYFYKIQTSKFSDTKKMILLK